MLEHPSQNIPPTKNKNNPTKEILVSSGIYNKVVYARNPEFLYAPDIPNSFVANTGINVTTTARPTTTTLSPSDGLLPLSSSVPFIHDILIFNSYIHYDTKSSLKIFNTLTLITATTTKAPE